MSNSKDGRYIQVVTFDPLTDKAETELLSHNETDMSGKNIVAAVDGHLCAPRAFGGGLSCIWCKDLKIRIAAHTL